MLLGDIKRQQIDSSFVCLCRRRRLPFSLVSGQESTLCGTVWMSLQSHIIVS